MSELLPCRKCGRPTSNRVYTCSLDGCHNEAVCERCIACDQKVLADFQKEVAQCRSTYSQLPLNSGPYPPWPHAFPPPRFYFGTLRATALRVLAAKFARLQGRCPSTVHIFPAIPAMGSGTAFEVLTRAGVGLSWTAVFADCAAVEREWPTLREVRDDALRIANEHGREYACTADVLEAALTHCHDRLGDLAGLTVANLRAIRAALVEVRAEAFAGPDSDG